MKAVADVTLFHAGAVLRLADERGNVGVGEASPLPGRSRETTAQALDALRSVSFDLDPSAAPREILARVRAATPSATFAVETAVLDLLGKRLGTPAWKLLGGHGARVPLNALAASLDDATNAARKGITTIKAKSLAVAEEIHAAMSGVSIRYDANGSLTPAEAARLPAWLEYVEQPCASLRGLSLPVPIAADESVIEEPEAALEVARVLVLKPTLLGGWLATLGIAERAFARGLDVVVTHALEGPIARAACASIALALPRRPRACGLDAHPCLAAWPAIDAPWITERAIEPHARPGLGIDDLPSHARTA